VIETYYVVFADQIGAGHRVPGSSQDGIRCRRLLVCYPPLTAIPISDERSSKARQDREIRR
jgi:hypothetical protein